MTDQTPKPLTAEQEKVLRDGLASGTIVIDSDPIACVMTCLLATLDAERAARAAAEAKLPVAMKIGAEDMEAITADRDRLAAELDNLKRTVAFQEEQYLKAHGGSWGKCKYQAEAETLAAELAEARKALSGIEERHESLRVDFNRQASYLRHARLDVEQLGAIADRLVALPPSAIDNHMVASIREAALAARTPATGEGGAG